MTSTKQDLRQRMEVAVSTYHAIKGELPDIETLYRMLGAEYASVIGDYAAEKHALAG